MTEKKRWVYLDALKALAMMCVCMYHFFWRLDAAFVETVTAGELARRCLWGANSVCVPLFMMVNGALLLGRRFDAKKHFVHLGKLALGMLAWFMITLVAVHAWRGGIAHALAGVPGMLGSIWYLYGYDGVTLNHLWFIQMLIAVYVLVPLIKAAWDSPDAQMKRALGIAALLLGAVSFLPRDYEHVRAYLPYFSRVSLGALEALNPARNGVYGAMIVYFILGGYLHENLEKIRRVKGRWYLLAFALGAAALGLEWLLMTRRNEAVYDIVYNGYNCLPTLVMSAALFAAAAKLEDALSGCRQLRALLGLVGRNTMATYYLHWIAGLTVCAGVSGRLAPGLVQAAGLIVVCSLIGEGMRRLPLVRHLV